MAKYRIIKRGDGKYQVQCKESMWEEWEHINTSCEDYPERDKPYELWEKSHQYRDYRDNLFTELTLAQYKLSRIIAEKELEKKKKEFCVVEEVSV